MHFSTGKGSTYCRIEASIKYSMSKSWKIDDYDDSEHNFGAEAMLYRWPRFRQASENPDNFTRLWGLEQWSSKVFSVPLHPFSSVLSLLKSEIPFVPWCFSGFFQVIGSPLCLENCLRKRQLWQVCKCFCSELLLPLLKNKVPASDIFIEWVEFLPMPIKSNVLRGVLPVRSIQTFSK